MSTGCQERHAAGLRRMLLEPVPELTALRTHHERVSDLDLMADSTVPLDGVRGDRLESKAFFEWESAEEFGLAVLCSPEGEEQTLIRFCPLRRELILDVTRSSVSAEVCNHQGIGNNIIIPQPASETSSEGNVECRERLGGLLKFYHRQAA